MTDWIAALGGIVGAGFFFTGTFLTLAQPKQNMRMESRMYKTLWIGQALLLAGIFSVMVLLLKTTTTFFEPIDSFTVGSIALIVVTFVYEKGTDDLSKKLLFLTSNSVVMYFLAGFIGVIALMFGNEEYILWHASTQNTLFLIASFDLLVASGHFIEYVHKKII